MAVKVIEYSVLSRTQVVRVAGSHHSNNVHGCRAALGSALAVYQEHAAELGHVVVSGHVADPDAEVAAALVNEQPSGLEYRPAAVAGIEVREYHIVPEKMPEITVEIHEFLHLVDGVGLLLERPVLLHEIEQILPAVSPEYRVHPLRTKRLRFASLLGGEPGGISGEARSERVPFRFTHIVPGAEILG